MTLIHKEHIFVLFGFGIIATKGRREVHDFLENIEVAKISDLEKLRLNKQGKFGDFTDYEKLKAISKGEATNPFTTFKRNDGLKIKFDHQITLRRAVVVPSTKESDCFTIYGGEGHQKSLRMKMEFKVTEDLSYNLQEITITEGEQSMRDVTFSGTLPNRRQDGDKWKVIDEQGQVHLLA